MNRLLRIGMWLLTGSLLVSCGDGAGGGSDGDGGAAFVGAWQYEQDAYEIVTYSWLYSTRSSLAGISFRILDQAGKLVRDESDCQFTVVPTTATDARGVAGEECTVTRTDASGSPMTVRLRIMVLRMSLFNDASQMTEALELAVTRTTTVDTVTWYVLRNNTLDRMP